MPDELRSPGRTTVAPEVLQNIAELTTLSVDGVSRLSIQPTRISRILPGSHHRGGVSVKITDKTVDVEIHVILQEDVNVRQVSREIQSEVARSISEMVGMDVGQIDVNIEDIDFIEP